MRQIFLLNKDKCFNKVKKNIENPLFFGYWNSINPDFGGLNLLNEIGKIEFSNIKNLVSKLYLEELDSLLGPSNNKFKNLLIIYGASIYDYAFVSLRLKIQFETLCNLLDSENFNKIYFSYEEIIEAHTFLSKEVGCLNTDVQLISNNPNVTNLILFYLSYYSYKDLIFVIDKSQRILRAKDLFEKIIRIKSTKLKFKDPNLLLSKYPKHRLNLNLVNSKSLLKKILKKVNFTERSYSKYFRSNPFIFFRKDLSLDHNQLDFSLFNFLKPEIDKNLLKKLFNQIYSISFVWNKITISSLHLSSIKVRILLNNLKDLSQSKCKIRLFNEHGSSFFKSFSHVLSVSEEDLFNATTVYRKNYPLKKNKRYEFGITTQKIPIWVLILRFISFRKKIPIFIEAQIFNDLKNNNYRYLLSTKNLNDSFQDLFKLVSKNLSNVGFVPSKNVRRGIYKDPIYNQAIKNNFIIINNYNLALINSSCLILTYPETTIVDAIFSKIPFLLFCDIDNYPLHPNSKIWYQKLHDFGVAYKLDEVNQLFEMLDSGRIYKLWKDNKFKEFIRDFKDFIL